MASKYRRDIALNSQSMNVKLPPPINRAINQETQNF